MKKQQKLEAKFDESMEGVNTADAIPYDMTTCFKVGDIISHSKFGIGRVLSCISPNKMQVDFREGEKILICVLKNENDEE
jgi:hypothetical protein